MSDPKTTPAYGRFIRDGDMAITTDGLTQYAEIAARFHAALLPMIEGDRLGSDLTYTNRSVEVAFNHADAFFAELAKRTAP